MRTAHAAGVGVDADVRHIEAYRTAVKAGVDRMHHVFTADALSDYSDEDLRLLVRAEKPIASGPSANILRGPYIIPTIEMRNAYARALEFPEAVDHPSLRQAYAPDIYAFLARDVAQPAVDPMGNRRPRAGQGRQAQAAPLHRRRRARAGGRRLRHRIATQLPFAADA